MYRTRILVNGRPIKVYHDGEGKSWIEGRKGTEFTIKVENNSFGRILAIVSVDGLNVINAEHEIPEKSRGYIIQSHSNINIPGWKISSDKVKKFLFTNKETSYAKKVGADLVNIGVIGVVVFDEKLKLNEHYYSAVSNVRSDIIEPYEYPVMPNLDLGNGSGDPPPKYPITTCSTEQVMGGSFEQQEFDLEEFNNEKIAVGSGEKTNFKTYKVDFERGSIVYSNNIYYDIKTNLIKNGIILEKEEIYPMPFPPTVKFCPDI